MTGRRAVRIVAEGFAVRRHLGGVDVVHHGGGTLPVGGGGAATVLTVHDVQYLRHPQYFSAVRRGLPGDAGAPLVAGGDRRRRAQRLRRGTRSSTPSASRRPRSPSCPTASTRREQRALPAAADLRRRYALGDRRVLVYPAITHPHKGHRLLVDLLAGPWSAGDLVLVLLGGVGAADDAVSAAIASAEVGDRIVRPGRVPAADRDGLVALAEALVFPSEYEGFGAPALEAMALGTPVICSDRAALPEVVGDAGVVLPLTVEAWADALSVVAAERDALVERGLHRAARFTTTASGSALAAAYRRAVAGTS